MNRLVAVASGAVAAWLWGCGGAPFTYAPGDDASSGTPNDATLADRVEARPDSGDATIDSPRDDAGAADGAGADDTVTDAASGVLTDAGADATAPSCGAGAVCVPPVPTGWAGPFELRTARDILAANCDPGFDGGTLTGRADLTADAATCSCGCGAAAGVQCSGVTATFYATSATCSLAASCATQALAPGGCLAVDESQKCGTLLGVVMSVSNTAPSQGSCAPVITADVPPATWATAAVACAVTTAPSSAGCPGTSLCAPAASPPFGASLCVERSGDLPCPTTGYTSRSLYYGALDDTRACSPCTCGAVTNATCAAQVNEFASTDGGCAGTTTRFDAGETCGAVTTPSDLRLTATPSGGSCAASVAAPTGAATPTSAMTFCCTP